MHTAISIGFESELAARLSTFATQRGLTVDFVVRELVKSQIFLGPDLQQSPEPASLKKRALAGSSGPRSAIASPTGCGLLNPF
jgi:hypothetical protein